MFGLVPAAVAVHPAYTEVFTQLIHDSDKYLTSMSVHFGKNVLMLGTVVSANRLGIRAGGNLFDDAYKDCSTKTHLRDGRISDLTVACDSNDEDKVNVSWPATVSTTWGLGSNAYSTSLVVLLDDGGDLDTKTPSPGSREAACTQVDAGVEVTVRRMATVVDTVDSDYLGSNIREKNINQSLTESAFMANIHVTRLERAERVLRPVGTTRKSALGDRALAKSRWGAVDRD